MTPLAAHLIVAAACIAPVLIFAYVGFSRSSKSSSHSDYFTSEQNVGSSDYANTSVGYSLQMAAVFLFAVWGIDYGLGALWVVLFWALGYAVLYALLKYFLPFHAEQTTLHGYLAKVYGFKHLRWVASIATVLGLWGTMMAEVSYTLIVLAPVVDDGWLRMGLSVVFLLLGTSFIIANGYKAEVRAERVQVPFAYIGLLIAIVATVPTVWLVAGKFAFVVTILIMFGALAAILIAKLGADLKNPFGDKQIVIPGVFFLALVVVSIAAVNYLPMGSRESVLDMPIFGHQLQAQGLFALFALFVANVLWMPVDFATWQRIGSVRGRGEEVLERVKRGTWRVMLESPATWALGAVLGIIVNAGGFSYASDSYSGLGSFANALFSNSIPYLGATGFAIYLLFVVGCIAVMLSTVDAILSAISFTIHDDILPGGSVGRAKVVTLLLVLTGVPAYAFLQYLTQNSIATILYGAYAMQLSLAVVVILALLRRRIESRAAMASVITGFAGTIVATIIAIRIPSPETFVLGPVFAVGGAIVGYILFFDYKGYNLRRQRNKSELKKE